MVDPVILEIREKFKRKMVVISIEAEEVIKKHKEKHNFNNFDAALDHFILEVKNE